MSPPSWPSKPPPPPELPEPPELKTTEAGVQFIKDHEGFVEYPMWDYGQYSVGYGSRCPDDKLEEYRENGIYVKAFLDARMAGKCGKYKIFDEYRS